MGRDVGRVQILTGSVLSESLNFLSDDPLLVVLDSPHQVVAVLNRCLGVAIILFQLHEGRKATIVDTRSVTSVTIFLGTVTLGKVLDTGWEAHVLHEAGGEVGSTETTTRLLQLLHRDCLRMAGTIEESRCHTKGGQQSDNGCGAGVHAADR